MFRVCGKHPEASWPVFWSVWSPLTWCEKMFTHPVASHRVSVRRARAAGLPDLALAADDDLAGSADEGEDGDDEDENGLEAVDGNELGD